MINATRKSPYAKRSDPRQGRKPVRSRSRSRQKSTPKADTPPRRLFNVSIPGDRTGFINRLREARARARTHADWTIIKIHTAVLAADDALRNPALAAAAEAVAHACGVYGPTGRMGDVAIRELANYGRPPVAEGHEQPFLDCAFIDGLREAEGKPQLKPAFLARLVSRLPYCPTPGEVRALMSQPNRTADDDKMVRVPGMRHDLIVEVVKALPDKPMLQPRDDDLRDPDEAELVVQPKTIEVWRSDPDAPKGRNPDAPRHYRSRARFVAKSYKSPPIPRAGTKPPQNPEQTFPPSMRPLRYVGLDGGVSERWREFGVIENRLTGERGYFVSLTALRDRTPAEVQKLLEQWLRKNP